MARTDVEDLLGTGDKSLADHEKSMFTVFPTEQLQCFAIVTIHCSALNLRDKDNVETSIFGQDTTNMSGVNGVTDTSSSLDMENRDSLENSDLNNAADSATEAESESVRH